MTRQRLAIFSFLLLFLTIALVSLFGVLYEPAVNPAPSSGVEATAPAVAEKKTATPTSQSVLTPNPPGHANPARPSSRVEAAGGPENLLEKLSSTAVPPRDLFEISIRLGKIPPETPRTIRETPPDYQPGDTKTFMISNIADSYYFESEATLIMLTEHASWWVANDVAVDRGMLERSARVFEEQTYPTNRAYFGSEWSPGIDGDPRVHIYLGELPGVGGYFSSADAFPRTVNPFSNEMEIFYINVGNARPGTDYFDGVLAHEYQHMIHWHTDRNEELWVNEGLSELAATLNGFGRSSAVNAYLQNPDLPMTHWENQSHPFYGSAFLLLNYYHERYGETALKKLVTKTANGTQGFDATLAEHGSNFSELFADWVVANLLNDRFLEGGRYGYEDTSQPEPAFIRTVRDYPFTEHTTIHQYGADYVRFEAKGSLAPLHLEVEGERTVDLLPTEPKGGQWMLWSNRGDDSSTSATRAFDLSEVDQAALTFWAWYDIEENYDYAYIIASKDGGKTWTTVPATSTVESNPHGNNLGHGFTGHSAGSAQAPGEAGWHQQRVDLTPFTGNRILLRFKLVTDDAINHDGFVVDDIEIPEIGYVEGFEEGLGGWQTSGFVRVDNELPQKFIIQAVAEGSAGTRIFRLPSDEHNRATLTVEDFGAGTDRVTLIVSGATPYTSQVAGYRYSARLEP